MAIRNDSTRSRVLVSSASLDAALSAYLQCVSRLESEAPTPKAFLSSFQSSLQCLNVLELEFFAFHRSHLDYLRSIFDGFVAVGGEA